MRIREKTNIPIIVLSAKTEETDKVLGLSIAKSFTEACGGYFGIEINGDMFFVTIEFDQVQES